MALLLPSLILCGVLGVATALATRDLRASRAWFLWHAFGGWVIPALRRLNEPASGSQLGTALVVAAVAMGLMLWAILWQGNIIAYQREVIRMLQASQFGGIG